MGRLPTGRVTFAFTDVVGSTRAIAADEGAYVTGLQALQADIASRAEAHGGAVVSTEGDGTFLAFPTAGAAVEMLRALLAHLEREPTGLVLRAGAHTGDATPIGDDYFALSVHVAARVSASARGGQLLVSQAVIDDLDGPDAEHLGAFDLKDIAEPVTLWRLAGDGTPPAALPARRTNVASPRTSFIGRGHDLHGLEAALDAPGLISLVGPGGLGKTRLASELALRVADAMPGGAWLVELAPVTTPEEVTARVADVLGIRGTAAVPAVVDELARRGPVLLVIDNCEQVVDAAAELAAALLDGCPDLRLLTTSREALGVPGERVVRLDPLSTAHGGTAGDAEALFTSRAEAAGARLTAADRAAVTRVCQHLDGLPLALELAAARAATMPIEGLADALRAGHIELQRRGGEERQRSLDALVEWSLRLLADDERRALFALSVFPNRFTPEMAAAVLRAVPRTSPTAPAALAQRSLVDLDGDHYRMLVTTRDVARRHLQADPELHDAARAALHGWAHARSQDREASQTLTPDEVQALQAALDWALDHELPGRGLVMERVVRWELTRNRSATSLALADRVMTGPLPTNADEVILNVAAVRLREGLAATYAIPVERVAKVVEIAGTLDDRVVRAKAMRIHASVLDRAGRHDEAQPLLFEALVLAKDDPELESSVTLIDLGVSFHLSGDLIEAERQYRNALEVLSPRDVNRGVVLANLGEALLDAGRVGDATDELRAARREAMGRPNLSAWVIGLLAEAEARQGNREVARGLAEQAEVEIGHVVETDPSIGYVRDRMRAALAAMEGDPTRA